MHMNVQFQTSLKLEPRRIQEEYTINIYSISDDHIPLRTSLQPQFTASEVLRPRNSVLL